jgi:hypothetical protein
MHLLVIAKHKDKLHGTKIKTKNNLLFPAMNLTNAQRRYDDILYSYQ